ncbi:MAG: hypothetical protein U9Q88_03800 [Bacillota bacterium]|jgi:hypothetical protein|uniref:hypothetical protein n=1 Tax=Bacillus sp. RO2 TaxID=2723913 RepID=UPI00145C5041|nr:hypothetical protein [Bacillus sp. RO2]MEA3319129.1 hypothetical protein [Bacillota bacterium]NMH72220.1 hypothetical protein [Bacillus sp. RO2]
MFDPTVFDNLKVVIEGDLYDLDLDGVVKIVDRKDMVDLAAMSRTFSMKIAVNVGLMGEIILSSDAENLSGEILKHKEAPGCTVKLVFIKNASEVLNLHQAVKNWKNSLSEIWTERNITIFSTKKHAEEEENVELKAEVIFDRLILEENIDDLRDMLSFMVETIN